LQFSSCSYASPNLTFNGIGQGNISVSWGSIILPNSFTPTQTFTISSFINGYLSQITPGYVGITMNLNASFTATSLTTTSQTNSDIFNISFLFTLPTGSPSGTIIITLPP
jgi:hypothetical protein